MYILLEKLGNAGVSTYGFIMYVSFIFSAIFIGYNMGVASPVGFNFGAQNHKELKNLYEKSVKIIACVSLVAFTFAITLSSPLASLFLGYNEYIFNLSKHAFKVYSIAFLFMGINIFSSAYFTALNNGLISGLISILRTLVFAIISVIVMPLIFDVDGIWLATPVAEFLASIVSILLLIKYRKIYKY